MTGRDRGNNFDALRLVAAVSVIFSHSFLLAEGHQRNEPLVALTGQAVLGLIGVFVFFVISGYLVTQSHDNTRSTPRFLAKRFLRIYPALAVCLAVCAFVIGAAVTVLPLHDYYNQPGVFRFVAMNLLMLGEPNSLPTVRFTGEEIGTLVDSPLWSLPYEVAMYGMVALLGYFGWLRPRVIAGLWLLGIVCALIDTSAWHVFPGGFLWLLGFFAAGMLIYQLRGDWICDRRLAILCVIGLAISAGMHALIGLFPVFGALLTLHLALDPRLPRLNAARFGDLSYGLYIYGWPVQQTVLWLFGGVMAWWQLFALALPISAALAFVSWHVVERPALSLKPGPVLRRRSA
jgi:peptidoglycan/LPS O-acetylase OafA/YrhL